MLLPKLKEEEDRELKSQRFFFFFSYVREREREKRASLLFSSSLQETRLIKKTSLPAESHHLTSRSAKRADGSQ